MSLKRNVLDITKLKTSSQRLARMYCGPNKGKSMR